MYIYIIQLYNLNTISQLNYYSVSIPIKAMDSEKKIEHIENGLKRFSTLFEELKKDHMTHMDVINLKGNFKNIKNKVQQVRKNMEKLEKTKQNLINQNKEVTDQLKSQEKEIQSTKRLINDFKEKTEENQPSTSTPKKPKLDVEVDELNISELYDEILFDDSF